MKKRLIEAGVLAAVFVVAVVVFSYMTNRGNDNATADLGMATLPTVSFSCEGYGVNTLNGYNQEMEVATMHDTITPITANQTVMNVQAYDRKISKIDYKVLSLDGADVIAENSIEDVGEQVTLSFDEGVISEERMLQLTLHVEGEEVYYYTRIKDPVDCNLLQCLDYVYDFHENALAKVEGAGVGAALEPTEEADNSTFQHVTIHSDYTQVSWGDLHPDVEGAERWSITEVTPSYTSVKLEYAVHCTGEENETDMYRVEEFFRVRMSAGTMYLLDYDRQMEQVFDGTKNMLSEKGLLLGIVPPDVPYMVNDDGTIVSFVQANELWNYNRDTDELSVLFSFVDVENTDVRNLTDSHEIKLIAIDEDGNTTFAVYGYMNRGPHEGEVGAAIYYYNIATNSIDEKVFIPSNKSAAVATEELSKLVYYSIDRNMLYTLVEGTLYEMDMERNREKSLVENLKEGQYVISDDGQMVAYQTNGNFEKATEVLVKNLDTGDEYTVSCEDTECIIPLGFVYTDFVSGVGRTDEIGTTISGETVVPMYKVEIRSIENEVIKTYESGQDYVLDVEIDDGMLTLNRAVKDGTTYTRTSPEHITNNEEKEESNISLDTYVTELKGSQLRLTFVDGIRDRNPKVLRPKLVTYENPVIVGFEQEKNENGYYVYAKGQFQGHYDTAASAVENADALGGLVVSHEQKYVWESGNRYLEYSISGKDDLINSIREQLVAKKLPMDIANEVSNEKALDLTGCTTEEMLYIINKGTPVIGMLDKDNGVILTGYDGVNVSYIETATGAGQSVPYSQMNEMLAGTGRTFVGYVE